ncbi:MAG: RHS repeat-associated core domain-containing protein [Chloroflexota bacterium]
MHSRQGYYPYGEARYTAGELPTDFHFTGQRNESTIGLYDYHARFYAPALGRFLSADTLVPDPAAPQSFNRYSYVLGNPLKYTDPSGHQGRDEWEDAFRDEHGWDPTDQDWWDYQFSQQVVDFLSIRDPWGTTYSARLVLYAIGAHLQADPAGPGWSWSNVSWVAAGIEAVARWLQSITWGVNGFDMVRAMSEGELYLRREAGSHYAGNAPARLDYPFSKRTLKFYDAAFGQDPGGTMAHELAHVWDQVHGLSMESYVGKEPGPTDYGIGSFRGGSFTPAMDRWAETVKMAYADPNSTRLLGKHKQYFALRVADLAGSLGGYASSSLVGWAFPPVVISVVPKSFYGPR